MEDLIVVGAGPAGAAAALAARRAAPGARVLLLDRAAFPRDKPCGDGIAPHALDVLAGLGAAEAAVAGYPPVDRLELRSPAGAVVARRVRRPDRVIPRRVLDARLVAAAEAAGVAVRRHRVRSVVDRGGHVEVDDLAGRVVVAADGASSTVRRLLGVAPNPDGHLAVAVRGYAPARPGPPVQRIVLDRAAWPAYWWSFAIGDGTANVGYGLQRTALGGGGRARLHGRLRRFADAAGVDPATLRAHHLPLSSARPAPAQGRVLLAGDAASLINPLSGEGIYYAVATGALAGRAAVRAPERAGAAYTAAVRALLGRHLRHTALLARLLDRPALLERGVASARRSQRVFDDLVELALGAGVLTPRLAVGALTGR